MHEGSKNTAMLVFIEVLFTNSFPILFSVKRKIKLVLKK